MKNNYKTLLDFVGSRMNVDFTDWRNMEIDEKYWRRNNASKNQMKVTRKMSSKIEETPVIRTNFDEKSKTFTAEFKLNQVDWLPLTGLSRENFIKGMVKKHFPSISFRDYEQIQEMGNIVGELGAFLAECQSYYSIMVDLPDYADVKGLTEKEWSELKHFKQLKTEKLRTVQRENEADERAARKRSEERLRVVYEELDKYKHNAIIQIFELKRKDLPLDVNQQISNYKPEDHKLEIKTASGSRVLGRKNLTDYFILQYRKHLLELYSRGENIAEYIERNRVKSFQGDKSVGSADSLFRILTSTGEIVSIRPDGTHHLIRKLSQSEMKEHGRFYGPDSTQDGTGDG